MLLAQLKFTFLREMDYRISELSDLPVVAKAIIDAYPNNRVFAFYGHMGAGKTTLIKEICSYIGVADNVASPSFAIVNQYTSADKQSVFHFDFYRIKKIAEVYDLGYEDYFYSNSYCFIEWPELIEELLPTNYVKITIEEFENSRIIETKNI